MLFSAGADAFYIFRQLCLSCNVKKPKTNAKLSTKSKNKHRSNLIWLCPLKSALTMLPFLTVALHESVTRKNISWPVTVYNKDIQSMQFDCSIRTSGGTILIILLLFQSFLIWTSTDIT